MWKWDWFLPDFLSSSGLIFGWYWVDVIISIKKTSLASKNFRCKIKLHRSSCMSQGTLDFLINNQQHKIDIPVNHLFPLSILRYISHIFNLTWIHTIANVVHSRKTRNARCVKVCILNEEGDVQTTEKRILQKCECEWNFELENLL